MLIWELSEFVKIELVGRLAVSQQLLFGKLKELLDLGDRAWGADRQMQVKLETARQV